MSKATYLITGAGTGFGKGIAFGLAEKGETVIAGVETMSEVSVLRQEARNKKMAIQIEKLDVTDPVDRQRAWTWEIDVLVNNAGIAEGGSLVDIPEEQLRHQFDVNLFGPILLTQKIAKKMVKKRRGKIIFMSSVSGLMADPFMGPYCGTKFAIEAFADSLSKELQEFNVQVATINPGPYLTGFNDREFEAWQMWRDDSKERLFNYEKLAFPYEQFDPEDFIKDAIHLLTSPSLYHRNVIPKAAEIIAKKQQKEIWTEKADENLGKRHPQVQRSLDINPGTTPVKGIVNRVKSKL